MAVEWWEGKKKEKKGKKGCFRLARGGGGFFKTINRSCKRSRSRLRFCKWDYFDEIS